MTFDEQEVLGRFHRALVRELRARNPERMDAPFTVAEIYQNLVPYRTHRDEIGVEMNADYEHALLRLLAGEGDFLSIESKTAREEIREELDSPNPNTGLYRDFAAADVHLNPDRLDQTVEDFVLERGAEEEGSEPVEAEPIVDEDAEEGAMDSDLAEGEYERLEVEPLGASLGPMEGEVASDENPVEVNENVEDQGRTEEIEEEDVDLPPFENCPWCREKLPQQARVRFCPFCGSNVQLVPCPSCGEELRLNWRFCIACGTEVES